MCINSSSNTQSFTWIYSGSCVSPHVHSDEISICEVVEDVKRAIAHQFENDKHLDEFLKLIDKAIKLSKDENIDDLEAII